jgi:hypothetical protein
LCCCSLPGATSTEEVNVDTTRLRDVDAVFQLNSLIVNSRPPGDALRCEGTTVQQFVRVSTGFFACANFNQAVIATMGHQWIGNYTDLRNVTLLLDKTREIPEQQNVHNMARIMRAYTVMKITDTYGNVPYLEAGRALEELCFGLRFPGGHLHGPEGILEELKDASAALSASHRYRPKRCMPVMSRSGGGSVTRAPACGVRLTKVAPSARHGTCRRRCRAA